MATYDNKLWLLSHIRNSFISTDDTGMCETVMAGEDIPKQLPRVPNDTYPGFDESSDEDDMDFQESYEIQTNYDNNAYRQRSNTAQYIEKMNAARKKAAKIKNIKWENNPIDLTDKEKEELFAPKAIQVNKNLSNRVSLLSQQLEKTAHMPKNPFIEYSKFDGSGRVGITTRKYKIFMTMLPESERNYPLSICIIPTAKVIDLIGLTCLKYSTAHPEYQFKPISHYDLHITEDDGDVDNDFPALDTKEYISKFGFTCLGLVEHKRKKTINFDVQELPQKGKSKSFDNEVTSNTGSKLKLTPQDPDDLTRMQGYTRAMKAPLYQSYRVFIITIMRAKKEVHLGISGEKVEIDPVQQKNSKFWVRQKAVCYHMDNIAWCEILESKSNRTTFRLVYSSSSSFGHHYDTAQGSTLHSSPSFKHHDFETDTNTAEEIVKKINHILELRSSTRRKEYLSMREKKANRRRSFHLGNK